MTRLMLAAAVTAAALTAPARAADVDALIPAEAEQVVNINIRQLMDSDLFKKYMRGQIDQALKGNDAKKMLDRLGLDPLKDLDLIHGGLWGEDAQSMNGLFVIRGKFDPKKVFDVVEEEAKKNGDKISIVKEGDYTLVKVTVDNRPDPIYASVADEKTIVIGTSKKITTDAMKLAGDKSTKSGVKKELTALVGKMDAKASMYVCGVSSGKVGDIPPNPLFDNPEKLKKQLEKLGDVSMTLRVTTDVAFEVVMGMKDTDAADDFGGTVDELLNKIKVFIPLAAMQNANLKPVTNDLSKSLKSSVKEKNVVISAKLTGEAIAKAAGSDD